MDTVFSAGVLLVVIFLVLAEGGANLDAPADPSSSDYPARPEWYFLSLFQMLKLFPGSREIIGTIVIPTALLVDHDALAVPGSVVARASLAHFLACGFVFAVVAGGWLSDGPGHEGGCADSTFQESRKKADHSRQRAIFLAGMPDVGIPPDGSAYILRRDPLTQGRNVLERRCLGCHVFEGNGSGTQTASDLAHFGSKAWVHGLLLDPSSTTYFGKVAKFDGMAEWKKDSTLEPKELGDVADFVASFAAIPDDIDPCETGCVPPAFPIIPVTNSSRKSAASAT